MSDIAVLPSLKSKLRRNIETTGKKRKKDNGNYFRKSAKKKKRKNLLEKNEFKENDTKNLTHGKESKSVCLCPDVELPIKNDKHSSEIFKKKDKDNNVMIKKKRRKDSMNASAENCCIVNDNETENNKTGEKLSFSDSEGLILSDNEVSNTSDVIILSDEESGNPVEKEKVWDGYSPLHHIRNGKNDIIKKLLERGYQKKIGRWTQDEVEQLNKNMDDFLENNKVKDFWGLIDARTKGDKQFRKKTDFVLKMCKGILRTGMEVDKKVYEHFGKPFLKTGKFEEEELEQLRKLHSKYGNDWKTIGSILNRAKSHIGNIFYEHKSWDKGEWSYEEDKALLSLVVAFKEKNQTVSWKTCSEKLKTRSQNQCFRRSLRHYSHIDTRLDFEKWVANRKKDDIVSIDSNFQEKEIYKLVTIISDLNIDDEFLIEWNELSKHFENVPSAAWLKLKFQAVSKEVPHSHRLEFPELIEQLMELYGKKVYKDVNVHICSETNDDIQIIEEKDDVIEIIDTTDDDNDVQILE